jgi:hypothetical protein
MPRDGSLLGGSCGRQGRISNWQSMVRIFGKAVRVVSTRLGSEFGRALGYLGVSPDPSQQGH